MYYGFPVISSDCIPIKRILEETNAGRTFPSGDPAKLAELMKSFITDQTLISKYAASTKAVENKFNWVSEAETLLALYSNLEKK